MKSHYKFALVPTIIGIALLSQGVFAATDNQSATTSTTATSVATTTKTTAVNVKPAPLTAEQIEKESYSTGAYFGNYLRTIFSSSDLKIDSKATISGFEDAFNGNAKLSNDEIQKGMASLQKRLGDIEKAKHDVAAAESIKEGDAFRATYAKQKGVKKTASGLLYKIEKVGKKPLAIGYDTVEVTYSGKLPNGKEFDNSSWHKGKTKFALNAVLPGWSEGLQLIGEGGKIELVIPPDLGYGDQSIPANDKSAGVPPQSTLIFDVQLVKIEK